MKDLLRPFVAAMVIFIGLFAYSQLERTQQFKKSTFRIVMHRGESTQTYNIEPPVIGHYEMHIVRSMSPHHLNEWQKVYPDWRYGDDQFTALGIQAFGDRRQFPLSLYFEEQGEHANQLRGVRLPDEFGPADAMLPQPLDIDRGSQYSVFIYDLEKKRFTGDTAFKLQDCGVFFGTLFKSV